VSPRHLVLAGAGHAHVQVLRSLAQRREPGLEVALVSPHPFATYTGMVPGVLMRQYQLREAQIDVRALAARAGAELIIDRLVAIDPRQRRITLQQHAGAAYDLLSLDIGSQPTPSDG